ncbi:MAG: lysophospholipid acyltransferase family protein [Spirochaetia bacterium]|jgi:1-acyl-sn-glycerol-3-phosphate acyltransferase
MIADISFALIRAYATAWMRRHCRVLLFGQEQLESLPRGRRVYVVLNHSTSYDAVALFHLSANRFGIVMDREAFQVPVIGRLLTAAQFIALDKRVSEDAVQRAVAAVRAGTPLLVSLTEGHTAIGRPGYERPRSGGMRIAHLAGADIFPVFVMIEEGRRRTRSFRGREGSTEIFTTFQDTLYFVSFLPPIPASSFLPEQTLESYRAVAEELQKQADRERERFTRMLSEKRELYEGIRRRGGSSVRVTW